MLIRRQPYFFKGEFKLIFKYLISGKLIKGDELAEFENSFRNYIGAKFGVLTDFGIEALKHTLDFYGFDKSTHLLIPSYTSGVVRDFLQEEGIPFDLIDIDPERGVMTKETLQKSDNLHNAKGILVTHLLGRTVDEDVFNICREQGLIIIEDCAHCHGAKVGEHMAGSLGEAAFYSFAPAKLINCFTGGILLTDNGELSDYVRTKVNENLDSNILIVLKKLFFAAIENVIGSKFFMFFFSFLFKNNQTMKNLKDCLNVFGRSDKKNKRYFKFTNIQAAIGVRQLNGLENSLKHRREICEKVKASLSDDIKFLEMRKQDVPYNLIAVVDNPPDFRQKLYSEGADAGVGKSIMEAMGPLEENDGLKFAFNHYIQLPCHYKMTDEDVEQLIKSMKRVADKA